MAEDAIDTDNVEPSEFNADGALFACPACCVVFSFASKADSCPICGYEGGFDTINL